MADDLRSDVGTMPDMIYAVRRADGEDMGDYSFMTATGPDDWQAAEDEADALDERVEYELVTFNVERIASRWFGPEHPPCAAYDGVETPPAEWWEVIVTSLSEDTWPARDHRINGHQSETDAELHVAALPEVFVLHDGFSAHEVRRDQLRVERKQSITTRSDCTNCGRSWWTHDGSQD